MAVTKAQIKRRVKVITSFYIPPFLSSGDITFIGAKGGNGTPLHRSLTHPLHVTARSEKFTQNCINTHL